MPETIDRLQIEIVQAAKGSSAPLDHLAASLSKLKSAVSGNLASNMLDIASAVKTLKDAGTLTGTIASDEYINSIKKLNEAMKGFNFSAFNKFKKMQNDMKTSSAGYQSAKNQIVPMSVTYAPYEPMKAIESTAVATADAYDRIADDAKIIDSTAREVPNQYPATTGYNWEDQYPIADNTSSSWWSAPKESFEDTWAKIETYSSAALKVASSYFGVLKKIASITLAPLKKAFSSLESAIKKPIQIVKNFISSIGRIAFYRLIRSAIKTVTEGFSEGVESMYYWSGLNDKIVSSSLDKIATAMQYLRNGFASMASPLITAFAPAIDYIADKFVALFNTIQESLAYLLGQSTWTKAVKKATTYKDALDDTSNAAKSAAKDLQQLMDFDELNNITSPSDSSSGSGSSGKTAADYEGLFTTEKVSIAADSFIAKLKRAIDNGDWAGVGSTLASKLNNVVEEIGKLNIGGRIAGYINNGVSLVHGFAITFDWDKVGKTFANGVNNFFRTVDWTKFGEATGEMTAGITDMICTAIQEIDFKKIFSSVLKFVNGFIDGCDWQRLHRRLEVLIMEITNKLWKWFLTNIKSYINSNPILSLIIPEDAFDEAIENCDKEIEKLKELDEQYQTLNDRFTYTRKYTFDVADATTKLKSCLGLLGGEAKTRGDELCAEFKKVAEASDGTKSSAQLLNIAMNNLGFSEETKTRVNYDMFMWQDLFNETTDTVRRTQSSVSVLQNAFESLSIPGSTASEIASKLSSMSTAFNQTGATLGSNFAASLIAAIKQKLQGSFTIQAQATSPVTTTSTGLRLQNIHYTAYASGGFPDAGDLFLANERGPELVGSMSNRTAVANNAQIVEGIASGVESANSSQNALLREQNSLLRQLVSKGFTISPSAGLGRVVQQSSKMYRTVTG